MFFYPILIEQARFSFYNHTCLYNCFYLILFFLWSEHYMFFYLLLLISTTAIGLIIWYTKGIYITMYAINFLSTISHEMLILEFFFTSMIDFEALWNMGLVSGIGRWLTSVVQETCCFLDCHPVGVPILLAVMEICNLILLFAFVLG
ncbi:hypothetical protein ACJX0J_038910 [Zea mays]